MSKKILNQNDIINTEIINSYDLDCVFGDNPINRVKNEPLTLNKAEELILDLKNPSILVLCGR